VRKKKGFVRILETILASMIILASLAFFFTADVGQSGWDNTFSEIRARDALNAGYKSGQMTTFIKTNNAVGLRDLLGKFFTRSTEFSAEVSGIPNPIIYLGCASCSPQEKANIEDMLNPLIFNYKGRTIEIRVEQVDPSVYRQDTDIMLFTSFSKLNQYYPSQKVLIDRFLQNGGTVFLLGDLTQNNISTMNSYLRDDIFGFQWDGSGGATAAGKLDGYDNPTKITYNIAKYYENISSYPVDTSIGGFNTTGATGDVNRIKYDSLKTVLETANKKFSFIHANRNINGNGRAIWIAGNDGSVWVKNLTKAAVMWASGERYKMDAGVNRIPGPVNRKASIIIYDGDTYKFEITTWNLF
jgi:hypothetical protein